MIMLVFKVSEEISDNREFYEVRKFDEGFKRVPRSIYKDDRGFHKCELKVYQRIKFKTDSGIVNVVAGDDVLDSFLKQFVHNEELLREYIGTSLKYSELDAIKTLDINTMKSKLGNLEILLCSRNAFRKQIESSLYYKIGKFLRLI